MNESKLKKDLKLVRRNYSGLIDYQASKYHFVEGNIQITSSQNYYVLIQITSKYPHELPVVWETTGKIPKKADYHVNFNTDNSLCLVVETEQQLIARRGITIFDFIKNILEPHLAMQSHKLLYGVYPIGEFAHGQQGINQYFLQKLNLNHISEFAAELNLFLKIKQYKRNEICICGSKKKFKFCHETKFAFFTYVGTDKLLDSFRKMIPKNDLNMCFKTYCLDNRFFQLISYEYRLSDFLHRPCNAG
jgi:SEC-C motif